jgi:hypothetical protein
MMIPRSKILSLLSLMALGYLLFHAPLSHWAWSKLSNLPLYLFGSWALLIALLWRWQRSWDEAQR